MCYPHVHEKISPHFRDIHSACWVLPDCKNVVQGLWSCPLNNTSAFYCPLNPLKWHWEGRKEVKFMASGPSYLPLSYSNHHNHPFFLHFMTGLHMLLSSPNNLMMKIWLQTEYKLLVWECTCCIRLCSITDCALSLSACTHSLSGQ